MSDTIAHVGSPRYSAFNVIAGIILALGLVVTVLRFTGGLSAVTNLDDHNPWGIWIGFDLMVGVALAAGGYVTSAAVYIFGMKRFHSAVRPAVLTGFLGYMLVVLRCIMMWDAHGDFLILLSCNREPLHCSLKWPPVLPYI
jgi:Ni/Fe-hydrogenase subunit HybB-like protein